MNKNSFPMRVRSSLLPALLPVLILETAYVPAALGNNALPSREIENTATPNPAAAESPKKAPVAPAPKNAPAPANSARATTATQPPPPPSPSSGQAIHGESATPAAPVAAKTVAAPKPEKSHPFPEIADSRLFPSTLYPGLHRHSPADFMLAGLAANYPGRVVKNPPAEPPPAASLSATPPLFENLPENVEYVRCRPNSLAQNTISAIALPPHGSDRIIDLRYFATPAQDADACANLCERLTGFRPHYNAQGNYPFSAAENIEIPPIPAPRPPPPAGTRASRIFVLTNSGTAGPIEAMLADLVFRKKITLVGTATAGQTANLKPLKNNPSWHTIVGEIQPGEKSESLVGVGIAPSVHVAISRENDFLACQRLERGERPATLLRTTRNTSATSAPTDPKTPDESAAAENRPPDFILRRAYDLALALRLQDSLQADTSRESAAAKL